MLKSEVSLESKLQAAAKAGDLERLVTLREEAGACAPSEVLHVKIIAEVLLKALRAKRWSLVRHVLRLCKRPRISAQEGAPELDTHLHFAVRHGVPFDIMCLLLDVGRFQNERSRQEAYRVAMKGCRKRVAALFERDNNSYNVRTSRSTSSSSSVRNTRPQQTHRSRSPRRRPRTVAWPSPPRNTTPYVSQYPMWHPMMWGAAANFYDWSCMK